LLFADGYRTVKEVFCVAVCSPNVAFTSMFQEPDAVLVDTFQVHDTLPEMSAFLGSKPDAELGPLL